MWEYLQNAPLGNLITIGLFVLIVLFLLIGVFAPEMARMASKRLEKEPESKGTDSDKLDLIKELLETKIDSLEKRQILTERQIEKTQSSIEGLVTKIDEGFRYLSKRLDDHIKDNSTIQSK